MSDIKVGLVTKEWPPHIYGGAGVHALQLTQALRKKISVDVHSFGEVRDDAHSHLLHQSFHDLNPALGALATDIEIAQSVGGVNLLHAHTWYANMAGHLGRMVH